MCDDPRNPHRLRFDSKREKQKTRRKRQIISDLCRRARLRVQHPGRCSSTSEEKVLSPPAGHSGNASKSSKLSDGKKKFICSLT